MDTIQQEIARRLRDQLRRVKGIHDEARGDAIKESFNVMVGVWACVDVVAEALETTDETFSKAEFLKLITGP